MKNILLLIFAVSSLLCGGCSKPAAYEWKVLGNADFTPGQMDKISLFVDAGIPYAAFDDYTVDDKATVMSLNGGTWQMIGAQGFSDGSAGYISLFISNGIPYTAFAEVPEGSKFITQKVMKYEDNQWVPLGEPSNAINSSFYVEDGVPYLLCFDKGLIKFTGEKWDIQVKEPFSATKTDFVSMCMDKGVPYALYSDSENTRKAIVKTLSAGKWVTLGNEGISSGEVAATSICVDKGTPYAAFIDKGNSGNACVLKFKDNKWVPLGKPGFSNGQAYYTSLCVSDGTAYLSYVDKDLNLVALKFDGRKWKPMGTGLSAGNVTYQTLFVDKGTPYIAFCGSAPGSNETPRATVMVLRPTVK